MNIAQLSRLLQLTEFQTPTDTIRNLSADGNITSSTAFKIMSMDYQQNNMGDKKAVKWVANSYGVFPDEIETFLNIYGDLGEAVFQFDGSSEDSETELENVLRFLELDCGSMTGNNYTLWENFFMGLSALEKKWFLRYWLRTPRNGINDGVLSKVLAKKYDKKLTEVKTHLNTNSIVNVAEAYEGGNVPVTTIGHGTFIKPMLAKVVPKSKWPKSCIIDFKYDGNRYQIHKQGDSVIVFNRSGKIVTPQFADIVSEVKEWEQDDFIIDTEIYPVYEDGSPAPHKLMGKRVHSKDKTKAIAECPVKMAIFDLLKANGATLLDHPYGARHGCLILEQFPNIAKYWRTPIDVSIESIYNQAIDAGFEGIMIKDTEDAYMPGKRKWVKHKPPTIDLDVVITGARYGSGKRADVFGSFDIAVKGGDDFISVGSIGTGFSDTDLYKLTQTLRKIIDSHEGGQYDVLPRIVLEVKADLVSRNDDGGYGLRFPRCKRIRDDKPVSDINTIDDVIRLCI